MLEGMVIFVMTILFGIGCSWLVCDNDERVSDE